MKYHQLHNEHRLCVVYQLHNVYAFYQILIVKNNLWHIPQTEKMKKFHLILGILYYVIIRPKESNIILWRDVNVLIISSFAFQTQYNESNSINQSLHLSKLYCWFWFLFFTQTIYSDFTLFKTSILTFKCWTQGNIDKKKLKLLMN